METERKQVTIIGGGPSGLIAAQFLSRFKDLHIHLYEHKASVGRKFLIAGRGGLNLTHSEQAAVFKTRYGSAERFLSPSLKDFSPEDLQNWAAELGVETFTGSSGRIFPREMKSTNLMRAWTKSLVEAGVEVHLKHAFSGFDDQGNVIVENDGKVRSVSSNAVLFAMGGASYPHLGATAAWVPTFEKENINVTPFRPMNTGFDIRWSSFLLKYEGSALKNIRFTFKEETARGDAMITRYGIEGGAVYALSRSLVSAIEDTGSASLLLDLRPDLSRDELATRLSVPRKKQTLSSFLRKRLKLSPLEIALLNEFGDDIRTASPEAIAHLIKSLPLPLTNYQPLKKAISASGGVALNQFNEDLMLVQRPGWFVAGEMIDWDAPTGGYLLQACFSTGMKAAKGIKKWLEVQAT
ncbi:TIGR03862 family flavoprotein [Sneathiella aquimaris]|uniref:TIGR03862 family flavoprotein n=1 Tax=Sneathiella aquimaris TaxID=2599305 RepID=UPI00146DBB33|nr:NAD(P)-dependent oxidoreductase [Sneathiella aquimaris]